MTTTAQNKPSPTERQKAILTFIEEYLANHGYSPSIREIASYFHIRSPKNVTKHLEALKKKGYISRAEGIARGIELISGGGRGEAPRKASTSGTTFSVPVLGSVKAGPLHEAVEDSSNFIEMDSRFFNAREPFMLKVEGESMTGAGIEEGDYLLIDRALEPKNNDIVIALIEGEATVKRFSRKGSSVILKPENPHMEPIIIMGGDFHVQGVVVLVIKNIIQNQIDDKGGN